MKTISLALGAALLFGPASAQTLTPESTTQYQGTALTIVTYTKPSFVAMTADRAAFALLGAFAMISAGNKLVKANDIADPAVAIAAKLGPLVADRFKASATTSLADHDKDDDTAKDAAAAAANKGLVFDAETSGWEFMYFPTDWTHYKILYTVRARIIDGPTGAVVASAMCSYNSEKETDIPLPTYDELMADQAALLKEKLAHAGALCGDIMQKIILGA
jgi:hypothetical protein